MDKRAEFTEKVKVILERRSGSLCSNPDCRVLTVGPHSDSSKCLITGEAAHIYAARPGGPCQNDTLSGADLKEASNGIWLCATCHTLVDKDDSEYTAKTLFSWKLKAENSAKKAQAKPKQFQYSSKKLGIPEMWCHETTNDDDYIPRTSQLDLLHKWTEDKKIKAISITGIGGQGKTSLVGYWVKASNKTITRAFDALFYWSFYMNHCRKYFLMP